VIRWYCKINELLADIHLKPSRLPCNFTTQQQLMQAIGKTHNSQQQRSIKNSTTFSSEDDKKELRMCLCTVTEQSKKPKV